MNELEIKIDGETKIYNIPDKWEEVTVEQFSNIFKIDREILTDIEVTVEVLKCLTDISEDDLYAMDPSQFSKVTNLIKFTNKDIVGTKVESIEVEGEKYFLKKDYNSLTMGEVISLELLMKEDSTFMTVMPEMLCIFLRKKLENGELESFRKSFMERKEIFKNVSIADVNDLFLFFSNGENSLESNMKGSLENQIKG